jgi:hypothetical protein
MLGTQADTEIARRIGIQLIQVTLERRRLGIGPYQERQRVSWNEPMIHLLGSQSDAACAKLWGLSLFLLWPLPIVTFRQRACEYEHKTVNT